jgi:hypothetical protein
MVYQRRLQPNLRQWLEPDATGTVASIGSDTLAVLTASGTTVVVPLASVTELWVQRGKKDYLARGMAIGSATGLVAGAIAGVIMGRRPEHCGGTIMFGDPDPDVRAACQVLLVAGLGVAGLMGGAAIGAMWGAGIQTDRWEEVPLDRIRVGVAPQRHGRFAVGFSVSF